MMMHRATIHLSILAGVTALGAVGVSLALLGLGVPLIAAALASGVAAGATQYGAARRVAVPAVAPGARLAEYRAHAAALRHDLRGTLSPALMMTDRLVNHEDPAVKKAGLVVVRSIDRATALLETNREALSGDFSPAAPTAPPAPAPR